MRQLYLHMSGGNWPGDAVVHHTVNFSSPHSSGRLARPRTIFPIPTRQAICRSSATPRVQIY